ncbi:hypothetical protein KIPB_009827, partial [Kipferlia bialata]|eukprot:g9827.t1
MTTSLFMYQAPAVRAAACPAPVPVPDPAVSEPAVPDVLLPSDPRFKPFLSCPATLAAARRLRKRVPLRNSCLRVVQKRPAGPSVSEIAKANKARVPARVPVLCDVSKYEDVNSGILIEPKWGLVMGDQCDLGSLRDKANGRVGAQ